MSIARTVLILMWSATSAAADPPTGYQCAPGTAKPSVGCACPGGFVDKRDVDGTALCVRAAAPTGDAIWTKRLDLDLDYGVEGGLHADLSDNAVVIASAKGGKESVIAGFTSAGKPRWRTSLGAVAVAESLQLGDVTWLLLANKDDMTVVSVGADGKPRDRYATKGPWYATHLGFDRTGGVAVTMALPDKARVGRLDVGAVVWTDVPVKGAQTVVLANGNLVAATATMISLLRPDGTEIAHTTNTCGDAQRIVVAAGGQLLCSARYVGMARYFDANLVPRWRRTFDYLQPRFALEPGGDVRYAANGEVAHIHTGGLITAEAAFPKLDGGVIRTAFTTKAEAFVVHAVSTTNPTLVLELLRMHSPSPPASVAQTPHKGELWRARSYADVLASDRAGNVYTFFQTESPWRRVIRKFDPGGKLLWDRELDDFVHVRAATTDASGNVYITGWAGSEDLGVAKLSSDGAVIWSKLFDGGGDDPRVFWNSDEGHAILVEDTGSILVAGQRAFEKESRLDAWILKLGPDGSKQWDQSIRGQKVSGMSTVMTSASHLVSDGHGGAWIGGGYGIGQPYFVAHVDASGKLLSTWSPPKTDSETVTVLPRRGGGAYAFASARNAKLETLQRHEFDDAGTLLGTTELVPGTVRVNGGSYSAAGGYLAANGNLVVAGNTRDSDAKKQNTAWVVELDSAGRQVWRKTYDDVIHTLVKDDRIHVRIGDAIATFSDWP